MIPPVIQPGDEFQRVRMPDVAGVVGKSLKVVSVSGNLVQLEWVTPGELIDTENETRVGHFELVDGDLEFVTQQGSDPEVRDNVILESAMQAYAQPIDSDLTAIAALSTTTYGRNLLTLANQAALQSAVGSVATLTTARAIYGNNFDGSAELTQIIASTFGGTGNGFTKLSGPTTAERTKILRDASDTILELGGSYTPTGTWTSLTCVTPVLGVASATSLTASGVVKAGNGAFGAPSYTFTANAATGFYCPNANQVAVSCNGVASVLILNNSLPTPTGSGGRVGNSGGTCHVGFDTDGTIALVSNTSKNVILYPGTGGTVTIGNGAGTVLGIKTIATLPSAASSSGKRYQVSDSATIVNRIAFSDGSAWYYEGTAVAV